MTAPRLVVVGHCTSTTARILCCDDAAHVARLAWRANGTAGAVEIALTEAPPYRRGVFDLRDLPAGGEVTYAIAVAEEAALLPPAEALLERGTRHFRVLPADRPPRVALLSCNGIYEFGDAKRRCDEVLKSMMS